MKRRLIFDRMLFFGTALSILIFSTSDIVTISITSPILFVVVTLAIWPVLTANIHVSSIRARLLSGLLQDSGMADNSGRLPR